MTFPAPGHNQISVNVSVPWQVKSESCQGPYYTYSPSTYFLPLTSYVLITLVWVSSIDLHYQLEAYYSRGSFQFCSWTYMELYYMTVTIRVLERNQLLIAMYCSNFSLI